MKTMTVWVKRNIKLFFKDKALFFTALITPAILLVLYVTFLENVYWDSFEMSIPAGMEISDKIIGAAVGGELVSSLLAVCCVTVAFCANMLMVQDKVTGAYQDMLISPVKRHIPAIGYYLATLTVTLLISFVAVAGGLIYLGIMDWYLTVADILLSEVDFDAMEMLVLPGGYPGYENIAKCAPAIDLLTRADGAKKTIAAICGAPSVPGKLGLLKGQKATCYPGMEDTLGCEALTDKVVESGHFITSRGAGTAVDFALALVAKAVSPEKAAEIAKGIVYA